MKHIGLFEGIGGFSYAAQLMGWQTVAWCEWKPFCQAVLRYHFPEAEGFGDITKTDFSKYANSIDILTGGFPCQPFSVAGNQAGVEDDRHLWPQMRRAIREIKPRIIVAENVAGLFTVLEPTSLSEVESKEIQLFSEDENYQINSTIQRLQRRVIATIIEEIRAEGYVLPTLADGTPIICCIPACGVNAPHRRDRVWFVGYSKHDGYAAAKIRRNDDQSPFETGTDKIGEFEGADSVRASATINSKFITNGRCINRASSGIRLEMARNFMGTFGRNESSNDTQSPSSDAANAANAGLENVRRKRENAVHGFRNVTNPCRQGLQRGKNYGGIGSIWEGRKQQFTGQICTDWSNFPTQPPLRCGDDGLSSRLVGITVSKHRNESIKAYGNAIVPQVALQIFKAIAQYEND